MNALDNLIETVKVPSMDELVQSAQTNHDKFRIIDAAAKRSFKNARRLRNWTGERYVKVEAADEL